MVRSNNSLERLTSIPEILEALEKIAEENDGCVSDARFDDIVPEDMISEVVDAMYESSINWDRREEGFLINDEN